MYLNLPTPVRAALHARAAELLKTAGAGDEVISSQLLAASPIGAPWAVRALRRTAQAAMERGAPDAAIVFVRRALQEPPGEGDRGELLRALANALARLGDSDAAPVLEQALELTQRPTDRAALVEASVDTLAGSGRVEQARRLLIDALADAQLRDRELVTGLSARLAMLRALYGDGDGERFVVAVRERAASLDAGSPIGRYAAGALALLAACCDGTATKARALAHVALGDEHRHAADARAGRPLHMALVALALAGEVKLALRRATIGLEASRARGSLMGQSFGLAWRSLVHVVAGHVADAETDARTALALVADTGLGSSALGATMSQAWALVERGEVHDAVDLLSATSATGLLAARGVLHPVARRHLS